MFKSLHKRAETVAGLKYTHYRQIKTNKSCFNTSVIPLNDISNVECS